MHPEKAENSASTGRRQSTLEGEGLGWAERSMWKKRRAAAPSTGHLGEDGGLKVDELAVPHEQLR